MLLPQGAQPRRRHVGPHPAFGTDVVELPAEHTGSFVDGIPAPLGIGKVKLADGSWVSGFVCEALGVVGGTDITALGSWRAWLAR